MNASATLTEQLNCFTRKLGAYVAVFENHDKHIPPLLGSRSSELDSRSEVIGHRRSFGILQKVIIFVPTHDFRYAKNLG